MPDDHPIGYVDSPALDEAEISNAVLLEGWALHRSGSLRVHIEREPRPGDRAKSLNVRGLVPLGEARFTMGTRPDVAATFPDYPGLHRACWHFDLRREELSSSRSFRVVVHAIAESASGATAELGRKALTFAPPDAASPYLFCGRPFDSVFIEPNGDVKPYPDCRPERAFGSLADPSVSLETIWFGPQFTELRTRIINRDPPDMCLTCAHFINRNVDDPGYFAPR